MRTGAELLADPTTGFMFNITESDTVPVTPNPQKIYVGAAGDLVLKTVRGEIVTLTAAVGWVETPGITHVMAATAATNLVGMA